MKMFVLFTSVITLLTTTGCFFPGHGDHGGRGWHDHDRGEVIVAPSAVAVRAPEVIVAPPVVEVSAPEVVVH